MKNCNFKIKLATLARRAALEAEQDKKVKLETQNLSYFLDKTLYWRVWFSQYVYLSTNT